MLPAITAYHATSADFTEFDLGYSLELGIHFGTLEQAHARLSKKPAEGARIFPVCLALRNPLKLGDAGTWDSPNICERLDIAAGQGLLPQQAVDDLTERIADAKDEQDAQRMIRDFIVSFGFDSIAYPNFGETAGADDESYFGRGELSYIIFDPKRRCRRCIVDARSQPASWRGNLKCRSRRNCSLGNLRGGLADSERLPGCASPCVGLRISPRSIAAGRRAVPGANNIETLFSRLVRNQPLLKGSLQ